MTTSREDLEYQSLGGDLPEEVYQHSHEELVNTWEQMYDDVVAEEAVTRKRWALIHSFLMKWGKPLPIEGFHLLYMMAQFGEFPEGWTGPEEEEAGNE